MQVVMGIRVTMLPQAVAENGNAKRNTMFSLCDTTCTGDVDPRSGYRW